MKANTSNVHESQILHEDVQSKTGGYEFSSKFSYGCLWIEIYLHHINFGTRMFLEYLFLYSLTSFNISHSHNDMNTPQGKNTRGLFTNTIWCSWNFTRIKLSTFRSIAELITTCSKQYF